VVTTPEVVTAKKTEEDRPSPAERSPRPRLPKPAMFDGDRTEWIPWVTAIQSKLLVNQEAIGGTHDQFLYVYSRLEGNVWKNVTTYVKNRMSTKTPAEFIEYLSTMHRDPNEKSRA
jgi:hypothetical protein